MPTAVEPPPPSPTRRAVLALAVVAVCALGGSVVDRLFTGGLSAPFDFAAFWVAGHLAANGENPYDPTLVRQTQRALGMDDTAIVIWNPPWALTLVMPFGAMPFRAAFGAWVLVHLALMVASAELLWRGLGGDPRRRWVAYLLTLTFVPTTFLIGGGQITAVVLFGLAGFLAAARADRPVLAGAVGALTAVKPHLLALFALWLLLEAARDRFGRRVLLGGVLVGLLACAPPTLANPDVWAHYRHMTAAPSSGDHYHLSRWTPPLAGWWLRTAVPGNPFWVQWVPLAVAAVGFVGWYTAIGRVGSGPLADHAPSGSSGAGVGVPASAGWGFDRLKPGLQPPARTPTAQPDHSQRAGYFACHLPWVVGVSLLAAPYGVWQHDLVLLLVPVFAVAARLAHRPDPVALTTGVAWLLVANAAMLVMMLNHTSSEWYVWVTPAVLAGCLLTLRLADRRVAEPVPSVVPVGAR